MPNFHFRLPSVDHGAVAFCWGVGLGLYVWLGLLAIGVGGAAAFVIACLSAFAIFLLVRVYGEEEPRRP